MTNVQENAVDPTLTNPPEIRIIESSDKTSYVFYRNQLIAQYQKHDNYSRNKIIAQLF